MAVNAKNSIWTATWGGSFPDGDCPLWQLS